MVWKFLAGGGEIGALMRRHDWSRHPLGPPDGWPQSLKTALGLLLNMGQPGCVFWGEASYCFYNDGCRGSIAPDLPSGSLGRPAREIFDNIEKFIGPQISQIMEGRGATSHQNDPIRERLEDVYATSRFSPIDDETAQNGVGGVFVIWSEATERVFAKSRLDAERERHKLMLQQMPGFAALLAGPEHRFEFVNDAYIGVAGHREFIGRSVREVFPDIAQQGFYELLDRVYATGESFVARAMPIRLARPDGDRFVDFIYEPVHDEAKRITGIFVGGYDVTERVRASERLRESEERLRLATENAEIGFWDVDPVNDVLIWPPRTKAMFGISPDVPVSMADFYAGLHPDDRKATSDAYAAASDPSRRALYDVEYRTVGKEDGIVRWVAAKGRGIFDSSGNCLRVAGTAIDITARKATERALAESQARYRALFEAMDEGFCIIEFLDTELGPLSDYIHVEANPAYTANAGIPDIVGKRLREIVSDTEADAWLEIYRAVLVTGKSTRFERELVETKRILDIAAYRVEPASRRQVAVLFQDVSARKQAEAALRDLNETLEARVVQRSEELTQVHEALRQAQKMEAIGQLTGGIAHDFNNLLGGISGSLELIERRIESGRTDGIERFLQGAKSSAKRAAALTQRLLAFSRRQTLDPKPTDINRLVFGMEDMIRRTVGPSITLEVVGAGGLWFAKVDAAQLESALLNLAINARDAMPAGGRITIETANKWLDDRGARERDLSPGQYISICVTDTGTGIPPGIVDRIFDPFFTTKPIGQGTGLGLSMIHGFVRQSGGQVRVYTEVGHGTTMCIYLPRFVGELTDQVAPLDPRIEEAGSGETVLVVDDEAIIRMLIVEVLNEAGYAVLEAGDATSGMKLLESDVPISLLISDVGLPGGMNGRQLADAARMMRPELKVLFVTGYAENAAVGNGHLEPGMEVITKPFAVTDLASKIHEMLEC